MRIVNNGSGVRFSGRLSTERCGNGGMRVDLGAHYPLSLLADKNVIGIAVVRRDGRVATINDYYLTKILGLTREEFERDGLNILDVTPEAFKNNMRAFEELDRTGCIQPFETTRCRADGSIVWTLQGYAGFSGPSDFLASFALDITDKKRAEMTSQYLLEANKIMASSMELQPLLEKIVQVTLVNGFCDFCTIHLREEDGSLSCRAVSHRDTSMMLRVKSVLERYPNFLSESIGPSRVVRTGISEMSVNASSEGHQHPLKALMLRSYISVPLIVNGEILGALTLTSLTRNFDPEDLKTVEALALRASQHIENARLHESVKKSTAELERSNRDLTYYASIAAHDLKSPLATSQSYLNLLLEECGGQLSETHRKWLEKVIDSNTNLLSQVDRLLSLSHSKRENITRQQVDLNSVVSTAIENLQNEMQVSGTEVVFSNLPSVRGDASLLTVVFQNLFSNSIRYRHPAHPPRIRVNAERGPLGWTFHVSDNGIGFDSDSGEKIFRLFEQLPEGARSHDVRKGHGIGLATCRKIVEGHGGRIWADSTPGKGARFSFTLPD